MAFNAEMIALLAELSQSTNPESLLQCMHRAAAALGFDKVLFGIQVNVAGLGRTLRHVISGYPAEFQQIYAEQNFAELDPTIGHCLNSKAPLLWSDSLYCSRSWPVAEEARRFGLHEGLSIPVHDPSSRAVSMVSLARDQCLCNAVEERFAIDCGTVLAHMVHNTVKSVLLPSMLEKFMPRLTPREMECLRWLAIGKSNSTISDIINISEATVNFHVSNVFRKLKVYSRVQAAAVALALGLVDDVGASR